MNKTIALIGAAVCGLITLVSSSNAQGTAFTYQGRLNDVNGPANGSYDLTVTLFGVSVGGAPLADPVTNPATIVSNGLFTTMIDFGNTPFANGANRWLEIGVRTNGSILEFETLAPRQPLTPTPYALFAMTPGGSPGPQGIPGLNGSIGTNGVDGVDGATGQPGQAGTFDVTMLTNYPSLDGTNTFTGTNTFAEMVLATNANNIFNGTFSGDGSGLTGIPSLSGANTFAGDATFAGNSRFTGSSTFDNPFLANPTIAGGRLFFPQIEDARFQGFSTFDGLLEVNGSLYAQFLGAQNINAQTITGDGSGLTGLNPANLTGTLADGQLSPNVALLTGTNAFTGTNTFAEMVLATNANNIFNGTFSGDGSGLTGIPSLSGANTFAGNATFAGNSSFTGSSTFDNPFFSNPTIAGGRLFFPQIEDARFQGFSTFDGLLEVNGSLYAQFLGAQNINAVSLSGDGSGLTGLNPANLTGVLADSQLSANVALLTGTNAFTGTNTFAEMVLATNANNIFNGAFSGIFSGNGAGVTNISWTNLATPPPGMVLIPAGSFTMGDMLDGEDDALPMDIYVSAFYMDVNLVNLSQWQSVYFWATDHGYDFANSGAGKAWNHPVQTLDWYDMVKWCNARSQQAGKTPVYYVDPDFTQVYTSGEPEAIYPNWAAIGYRLPTESEWEKAARGGLSGQRFPWGNVIIENLACYNASTDVGYDLGPLGYNPAFTNGVTPYTSPVGSFAPNGYGLSDMAGNVAELCWDWYGTPYGQPTANNPTGPASGESHIQRGGDWDGNASGCRSAFRSTIPSNVANANSGFRTVLP